MEAPKWLRTGGVTSSELLPPHLTSYRGCQTFVDAFDASPAPPPQALGSRGGKRAGPGISLGGREPFVGGLAKGSSARWGRK